MPALPSGLADPRVGRAVRRLGLDAEARRVGLARGADPPLLVQDRHDLKAGPRGSGTSLEESWPRLAAKGA